MGSSEFVLNYSESNVNLSIRFNNYTFTTPIIPQPTNRTQVFYFKIETNVSKAIDGVEISLRFNRSALMFTDRSLWVFQYDDKLSGDWTRLDTNVDLETGVVTFQMPSVTLDFYEFCLAGQFTRFSKFPIWGWILLPTILGIIVFMAVGELVNQSIINVKLKGTDGRIKVKLKQFFAAWGRIFVQLDDRVKGFIDVYEHLPRVHRTTRQSREKIPPVPGSRN